MAETERQANITIEAGPLGLAVKVEYTGALTSIPAAIERMRSAGILELVSAARAAQHTAPLSKPKAERVEPGYAIDGSPVCPKHDVKLREGKFGLFCPAKDDSTERGYCALKFKD